MSDLDTSKRAIGSGRINHQYVSFLLILAFYYLSYRYPLQINSADTSPTYRDTPFVFAITKYVLVSILLLYYFMRASISLSLAKNKLSEAIGLVVILYLFTHAFLGSILSKNVYLLEAGIFFVVILPIYVFKFSGISMSKLSKYVTCFIYLSIAFELLQVILFYSFGRLPALAYKDSLLVRFGSIWDDPNGFSFVITFLIAFVVYGRCRFVRKVVLILILFSMLLITQSFTGIAAAVGAFMAGSWILVLFEKNKKTLKYITYSTLFGIICVASIFYLINTDLFAEMLFLKSDSISEHLNVIRVLENAGPLQLFGLSPYGLYGESGYVNILLNFGFIYLLLYMSIGVITVIRIVKAINKHKNKPGIEIFYGMLYFVIAFYIGMLNLPLETVFPLNLLVVVFYILAYVGAKASKLESNEHLCLTNEG